MCEDFHCHISIYLSLQDISSIRFSRLSRCIYIGLLLQIIFVNKDWRSLVFTRRLAIKCSSTSTSGQEEEGRVFDYISKPLEWALICDTWHAVLRQIDAIQMTFYFKFRFYSIKYLNIFPWDRRSKLLKTIPYVQNTTIWTALPCCEHYATVYINIVIFSQSICFGHPCRKAFITWGVQWAEYRFYHFHFALLIVDVNSVTH